LTFNPANMAVSFTSGSSLTQSQDAPSLKECNPETLSVSLNLGSAESGPSRCPSEPDSTCWPRPGDSADVARDMSQPTATPRGCYRSSRHSELVGYSAPGRNGQGNDFVKGNARATQALEDKVERPENSEAEGNQVSASLAYPAARGKRCGMRAGVGKTRDLDMIWRGAHGQSMSSTRETPHCTRE
jgi:hypothetical protein